MCKQTFKISVSSFVVLNICQQQTENAFEFSSELLANIFTSITVVQTQSYSDRATVNVSISAVSNVMHMHACTHTYAATFTTLFRSDKSPDFRRMARLFTLKGSKIIYLD